MDRTFATSSRALALTLLVAAVFLLAHPYTGIRHDGTLYLGDALTRLLPGEFRDDLYFKYGSQGRFTLLPALYALLIFAFGIGGGTIVGLLAAFTLYLAATFYLVAWFAPARLRFACVLAVVLGWTLYGGNRIFGYSEPFLTARSFAEPTVLLALGLLVRGRVAAAFAMTVVGLLIHPLIGAAGVFIVWLWLLHIDRRWALLGLAGAVALAVLGALQIGPFSDVFARYDSQWLDLVRDANAQAFILLWSWSDYGVILYDVVALWFAWRLITDTSVRTLITTVATAGLVALVFSLVAVDLLENPFFGKLQLWRCAWVMQWLAMASLPLSVTALWKRDEHGRTTAALLVIGWMAMFTITPAIIAVIALAIEVSRTRFVISRATTRIAIALAAIAAATIVVEYEVRTVKLGLLLGQQPHQIFWQALSINLLLLLVALLLGRALPRFGPIAGVIVAVVVFAAGAIAWDQRSPWTRQLEGYPLGTHVWPGLIEPDAKVYWYRDLIAPWVLLGHANYSTAQQNSGAVFSRDLVIESDKRRAVTALLDFQEQVCRMMNNLSEKQSSCEPDAAAVQTVCQEGGIDYVVLQSHLEGRAPLAELTTGVVENGYEKKFFLYRCSALKAG
jgi:hypothetical protein